MRVLVNIDVPELAPAIAFYTSALGLTLSRVIEDDVAELTGASTVLYLLQKPAGARYASAIAQGRNYARHWTPVHIDFVVDDLEDAVRRAMNAGAIRESECVEWRGSRCVTFSDPFGHGFCLIEFAGETYAPDEPGLA